MASKNIVEVTNDNYDSEVMKSDKTVLVDLWAQWCGPCRAVAPIIDEIADEYAGKLKVCKINVDSEADIAGSLNVMSIPTLLIFKDGKIVEKLVGARPKQALIKLIDSYL